MSSLNNIEKLIQMATIEQMYSILNKMKDDNTHINNVNEYSSTTTLPLSSSNNDYYSEQLNLLSSKLQTVETKLDCILKQMSLLNKIEPMYGLLTQMVTIQDHIRTSNGLLVVGQSKITDYLIKEQEDKKRVEIPVLDLTKCEVKEEPNISLVISDPEKTVRTGTETVNLISDDEVEEEETIDEDKKDEIQDILITSIVEEEHSEEEVGTEEEEEEEVEVEEEVEEEEEEEVEEEVVEEEVEEEVVEEEVEKEVVEEEAEEEVFEIEIDDVTYYATDENNGILYEATEDGDVGKKVGIIKDGEPIFDE
jgi:hypothetical protein